MQIVETSNEGLKRAYAVTIPAADIAARVDGEIKKIAPQVRMPGFRAGKVPANLVRKMHGPALHQEALQTTIREAMDKLVADHQLRPAMQPDVALGEGYEEGKDATLTVSLEVLPKVEAPSLEGLKLEKLTVPVTDAQVDEAVERIAAGQKSFTDAEEGAEAKDGDQLIIDFLGKDFSVAPGALETIETTKVFNTDDHVMDALLSYQDRLTELGSSIQFQSASVKQFTQALKEAAKANKTAKRAQMNRK
jgi:trigger factor